MQPCSSPRDAGVELLPARRNGVRLERPDRARGAGDVAFGNRRPGLLFAGVPTSIYSLGFGEVDNGGVGDRIGRVAGCFQTKQVFGEPVRAAAGVHRLEELFLGCQPLPFQLCQLVAGSSLADGYSGSQRGLLCACDQGLMVTADTPALLEDSALDFSTALRCERVQRQAADAELFARFGAW